MDDVYLGIWTNWSGGVILGPTLTLTRDNGNLLIAFVAFFIAFVSTRFWKICCLFLHRYYSSSKPQDTICLQRQVILRNSSSPESGLASFLKLFLAWYHKVPAKKLVVFAFPATFAVAILAAFTVAGGFSSRISTSAGDKVLIRGTNCGIPLLTSNSDIIRFVSFAASRLNNAANYAEQCYNNTGSGTLECNKFVTKALPTTIDRNASCPFTSDICQKKEGNLRLDTGYIDSNDHFGLNAPSNQRFQWRYVMHCAPNSDERVQFQFSDNGTWVRYHYGESLVLSGENRTAVDYTYEVPSIEAQYGLRDNQVLWPDGLNFRLASALMQPPRARPIEALIPPAGDVTIIFLSGYGISFIPAMDDDWYRATVPYGNFVSLVKGTYSKIENFVPVEAASPLACVEQWQWCNSALPEGTNRSDCGPLDGFIPAAYGAAHLFNLSSADLDPDRPTSTTSAGTRLIWPLLTLSSSPRNVATIIEYLGAKSLISQTRMNAGVQYSLPRDQWHYDVTHWFQTALALVQASFIDVAIGPGPYGFGDLRSPSLNAQEEKLCTSQKIRSSGYTSFNVFGLLFTVTVGGFIVGMSYALEPILTLLHRRRGYQQYAYLEWVSNQSLQLHRLAHEDGGEKGDPDRDNSASTGRREWLNCTKDVPVTGADVQLAPLDITDMEHPLLLIAITTEPPDTATAAGSEEDQLNLPDLELPPLGFPITTESTSTVMPDESNEDQADTSAAEDLAQSMPLPMTTKPSDIATPVESAEDNNTERRQVRSHFLE